MCSAWIHVDDEPFMEQFPQTMAPQIFVPYGFLTPMKAPNGMGTKQDLPDCASEVVLEHDGRSNTK